MINKNSESARFALVAMLRKCADYLSALPADEVDALLDGELEFRMSVVAKKGKTKKKTAPLLDAEQMANIAAQLRAMDNRASGERLLQEVAPTKVTLEAFARYLDVAVRREDRQDDLARRIIDSTIGFRLSTAAIHGRNGGRIRNGLVDSVSDATKK